MENYNGLCEPDEHCYHQDSAMLLTVPPKYRMICCNCGDIKPTHQASYMEPPDFGYFQ